MAVTVRAQTGWARLLLGIAAWLAAREWVTALALYLWAATRVCIIRVSVDGAYRTLLRVRLPRFLGGRTLLRWRVRRWSYLRVPVRVKLHPHIGGRALSHQES